MRFLKQLQHFPEFVKLSHSVFAMPFALASLILAAQGLPPLKTILLVIAAVFTARFAAMAFNRVVDAQYDAANPRTSERHIPSGKISAPVAWAIVVAGAILFISLSIKINFLAGLLSPLALLVIFGYSFTKRFTRLSHFVLGIALGLAPLGAWVAVQASLANWVPWLLSLAVICWVGGFDMIYALQDIEFDRSQGLHSMAVSMGEKGVHRLVILLHSVMFLILITLGIYLKLRLPYYLGLLIVLASLAWEQWLISRLNQNNLQLAFLQANGCASFGYLAAVICGTFL